MKYKNRVGHTVDLEDKELFTAGGQGRIYKVKGEISVGKLYISSDKSKLDKLDKKLCFMVDNPPFDSATPQEVITSIIWPIDILYDYNNNFVGFVMPLVQASISLEELVVLNKKVDKKNHIVQKFTKLNNQNFHYQRLVMCYNLASVLKVIHQRNQYVVVDLKPQNILIDFDGKIALIDIDSIQVQTYSKIYYADAHTPEYAPPEFHNGKINYTNSKIDANWDYFAFASTAYQVLFQLPPFVGTVDGHTEQVENIAKQYFPHGRYSRKYKFIPPPHQEFKQLKSELKKAFIDTFDNKPKDRISFDRWMSSLLSEIKNIKIVKPNIKQTKNQNFTQKFHKKKTVYPNTKRILYSNVKKLTLKVLLWSSLILLGIFIMFNIHANWNKVDVYIDIFDDKNHFSIEKEQLESLIDKQTINGIVWEQYIVETKDGSRILWIKKDKL